jgi:peptidoglycan/xylan/chitin deacetylase (PgdA/CDA1 family)
MKPTHLAILSTGLVLAVGVTLVSSVFFLPQGEASTHPAMLSFDIQSETNLPQWCKDLSAILKSENVKATVFVAGKIADGNPECVNDLADNDKLDIGSSTYSHVSLPSVEYLDQLEEVRKGKDAVDKAGSIDSLVFKAPYLEVDENIYSSLNQSGILADFSYNDHYNKEHEDYFIWFNATSYNGAEHDANYFRKLPAAQYPLIITFDNEDSIEKIRELIQDLKKTNINLVNASDLTHLDLTIRRSVD